jgi:hypothetical protein
MDDETLTGILFHVNNNPYGCYTLGKKASLSIKCDFWMIQEANGLLVGELTPGSIFW